MKEAARCTAEAFSTDQYQLTAARLISRPLHEWQAQFDHFFRNYPDYHLPRRATASPGFEWFD